jgi:hypothetical protein
MIERGMLAAIFAALLQAIIRGRCTIFIDGGA